MEQNFKTVSHQLKRKKIPNNSLKYMQKKNSLLTLEVILINSYGCHAIRCVLLKITTIPCNIENYSKFKNHLASTTNPFPV